MIINIRFLRKFACSISGSQWGMYVWILRLNKVAQSWGFNEIRTSVETTLLKSTLSSLTGCMLENCKFVINSRILFFRFLFGGKSDCWSCLGKGMTENEVSSLTCVLKIFYCIIFDSWRMYATQIYAKSMIRWMPKDLPLNLRLEHQL